MLLLLFEEDMAVVLCLDVMVDTSKLIDGSVGTTQTTGKSSHGYLLYLKPIRQTNTRYFEREIHINTSSINTIAIYSIHTPEIIKYLNNMIRPQHFDLTFLQLPSLPPFLDSPQKLHNEILSSVPIEKTHLD
jgi:hypothetical protein